MVYCYINWPLKSHLSLSYSVINSVHSAMSNSLQPHGLQYTRLPCPSPNPRVYKNSHPLIRWWHLNSSSSVVPFSSSLQSFPAAGSFSMSQFFTLGDQITGNDFSISPSNEHSGLISFRIDGLDLLAVQGTLKSLHQHHSSKTSVLWHSAFFVIQLSHPYMTTGKNRAWTRQIFNVSVFLICCLGWS